MKVNVKVKTKSKVKTEVELGKLELPKPTVKHHNGCYWFLFPIEERDEKGQLVTKDHWVKAEGYVSFNNCVYFLSKSGSLEPVVYALFNGSVSASLAAERLNFIRKLKKQINELVLL